MKTNATRMLGMFFAMGSAAWAGEASTSATAGSRGYGPGTAAATANYDGNGIGFTKTKANSGSRFNFARGLSVGFDGDGLSLSNSYAFAPQFGPAVGGTMNLHIGLDGQTSVSTGRVESSGDPARQVAVNGSAGSYRGRSQAVSAAHGVTGPRGTVRARTHSAQRRGFRAQRPRFRDRRHGFQRTHGRRMFHR